MSPGPQIHVVGTPSLENLPESGKPLKHVLKGHRRLVIKPFRIIYRIENDSIRINFFEHRKKVYK